jgi:hypothetical protein
LWVPIASYTKICTISSRPSKRRPRCARALGVRRVGRASCWACVVWRADLVPISCRSRADLARLHGLPPPPSRSRVPPPPQEAGVQFSSLESSCFNGSYVTESAVSVDYLATLARTRSIDRGGDANETHLLDQLEIPLKVQRVS